eukprot:gb/GFBE01021362.1/.p1 GENE.gb/GFBE01021362.1/~~gb/GFBE01021362.1/.p1  ORF type:complete len:201 (+),score=50.28 gb/GFBE01021362.1/:1-603(+)
MGDDAQELLFDRLTALAPGGSTLEPFLRGFQDSNFQAVVQQFVAERAAAFTVTCQDGSHPLAWTQYHNEYREMYERQLNDILQGLTIGPEEFAEFCEWLRVHAEIFEDDSEGLYPFIEAVTASEEYTAFLNVMFTEVRRQQLVEQPADTPQTEEIDIAVPEGMGPGDVIAVEYLGARYELAVPEGYGPGMVFRTAITLPA